MTGLATHLLVVDQHPADMVHLQSTLQADPLYPVLITPVGTLAEGLGLLERTAFDVVLLDPDLPDSQGLASIERLRRAAPQLPIVVWSEANEEAGAIAALRAGAQDYLRKDPCGFALTGRVLRYAIERQQVRIALAEREWHLAADTMNAERTQAAEALREARDLFHHLFHRSPIATILTSLPERVFLDSNTATEQLVGYPSQELIGRSTTAFMIFVRPEEHEQIEHLLAAHGRVTGFACTVAARRGAEKEVLVYIQVLNLHGKTYALTQLVDVTERKQAEATLRMSEARFATIFERSPIAISISRLADNRIVQVNAAFLALTGYPREGILGRTTLELNLWARPEERQAVLERLHRGQQVRDTETSLRQRSGAERTVLLAGDVIELNGEPCGLTGHLRRDAVLTQARAHASVQHQALRRLRRQGRLGRRR